MIKINTIEDAFKADTEDKQGYKQVEKLFVDSSGFGTDEEPALSVKQFKNKIEDLAKEYGDIYGKIENVGQFQIYYGVYIKK